MIIVAVERKRERVRENVMEQERWMCDGKAGGRHVDLLLDIDRGLVLDHTLVLLSAHSENSSDSLPPTHSTPHR